MGLGNPGDRFEGHRHNVGYWMLDKLIQQNQLQKKEKPGYEYYVWQHDFGSTYLLRSKSYMNDSGIALRHLMHYYKIPIEDVWVAYDEMDFAPGIIRIKRGGGAGGHNGVKSIIQHVGPAIARLRFGVGRPSDPSLVKQYVLTSPNASDRSDILDAIDISIEYIDLLLQGKYDDYTAKLHTEIK